MSTAPPLIIVNPVAGRGVSENEWARMATVIRDELGPFDWHFTRSRGDGVRIAREGATSGRRLLISVGGDGTVSEVANGILKSGTGAELGMLPGGTGSDYRKILGLSPDLATAAREIRDGTSRVMDAGFLRYVDHAGNSAERHFINTASFGISGLVAGRVNQSSRLLGGTLTYLVGTLRAVLTHKSSEVLVEWNASASRRLKIVMGCVSIGPTLGGGMVIAPDAITDDGLLDTTLIGDLSIPGILLNSYRLYNGSILRMRTTESFRAPRVRISPVHAEDHVLLEVDGESPGRLPATMEIVPKALRVRVPGGARRMDSLS